MLVTTKQLNNLPVETESGRQLGHVSHINIETESQSLLSYAVKPTNLIKSLITGNLEINRGQIVDITKDKIIVEDNAVQKEKSPSNKIEKVLTTQESGAN